MKTAHTLSLCIFILLLTNCNIRRKAIIEYQNSGILIMIQKNISDTAHYVKSLKPSIYREYKEISIIKNKKIDFNNLYKIQFQDSISTFFNYMGITSISLKVFDSVIMKNRTNTCELKEIYYLDEFETFILDTFFHYNSKKYFIIRNQTKINMNTNFFLIDEYKTLHADLFYGEHILPSFFYLNKLFLEKNNGKLKVKENVLPLNVFYEFAIKDYWG